MYAQLNSLSFFCKKINLGTDKMRQKSKKTQNWCTGTNRKEVSWVSVDAWQAKTGLWNCFSEEDLVCLSIKDNLVERETEQGLKPKSDFENSRSLGTRVVCCSSSILYRRRVLWLGFLPEPVTREVVEVRTLEFFLFYFIFVSFFFFFEKKIIYIWEWYILNYWPAVLYTLRYIFLKTLFRYY